MFMNNSFAQNTSKQESGSQMFLRSSILYQNSLNHHSSLQNIQGNFKHQKTLNITRSQKNSNHQIQRKKDKKAQDKENQSKLSFGLTNQKDGKNGATNSSTQMSSQNHEERTNYSECVSQVTRNNKRQKIADSRNQEQNPNQNQNTGFGWIKSTFQSVFGYVDQDVKSRVNPLAKKFKERQTIEPSIPQSQKFNLKTRAQAGKFSKERKFQEDEIVIQETEVSSVSQYQIEKQFPQYFQEFENQQEVPEFRQIDDQIEPNDYVELNIQSLKAYQNIKGDFIDHGHTEVKHTVDYLINEGFTSTKGLPEVQLQFPLFEDQQLKFLDKDTKIGAEISRSIVRADFDDDVATDEDMETNATKIMQRELSRGINRFLELKAQDKERDWIKNIDAEQRYKNEQYSDCD